MKARVNLRPHQLKQKLNYTRRLSTSLTDVIYAIVFSLFKKPIENTFCTLLSMSFLLNSHFVTLPCQQQLERTANNKVTFYRSPFLFTHQLLSLSGNCVT
jgi:hypothetical protein